MNGWFYNSQEFLYKFYIDEPPQIVKSVIICDGYKFILSQGSSLSIKPTVRASALGKLKKTNYIMIKSKSLTLIKI